MIYIRTDSNNTIATGHVMRCLSIAKALRKSGEECIFITADSRSDELIKSNGFDIICLNSEWNNPNSEIEDLINIIKDKDIKKLLIDSYYVTEGYLESIKKYTKLIYIDDINSFSYPVDMLINYSGSYENFKYDIQYKNTQTKLLLGYDYVPLREEFQNIKSVIRDNVEQILFTMGGTDENNITARFIESVLDDMFFYDIIFHIVIGSFNKNLEELNKLVSNCPNIKLHYNVNKISELMNQCDIAISAGGTTLLELCACGIPTIGFTIADNQIAGTKCLEDKKAIIYVGDARYDIKKIMENTSKTAKILVENIELRNYLSKNMKNAIDANGANRIANEINLL
ncbi:UDP-2,4-diacetamido-2,4,6-trideoxy-beta-L-altropyranose hydrolase [Clostridium beijerinckii]|uniref:UDP-2,4-diacetamido-2,4, 6-trideoxy-beta-L-altropyranose hydrolase n=1 Tax=Clostridium beijerinckii TaxID=1520 RepID=A0A7X9SK02_CLOBE|nr:UDP-2,4-diacetamido-2,4,6-trideoxy-beta-L-altropyranose hydrolase [Clostridium beijerinckii]NMF03280.1 UDP-2,4-diacetamido-2,4,6-trideoxy-beta-L-altropyranose hydrolase [Clostridium beijerinckii]